MAIREELESAAADINDLELPDWVSVTLTVNVDELPEENVTVDEDDAVTDEDDVLDVESDSNGYWCGRCAHGPSTERGIGIHNSRMHDGGLMLERTETAARESAEQFDGPIDDDDDEDEMHPDDDAWCGRCGDGPWSARGTKVHNGRVHGDVDAILVASEEEARESMRDLGIDPDDLADDDEDDVWCGRCAYSSSEAGVNIHTGHAHPDAAAPIVVDSEEEARASMRELEIPEADVDDDVDEDSTDDTDDTDDVDTEELSLPELGFDLPDDLTAPAIGDAVSESNTIQEVCDKVGFQEHGKMRALLVNMNLYNNLRSPEARYRKSHATSTGGP